MPEFIEQGGDLPAGSHIHAPFELASVRRLTDIELIEVQTVALCEAENSAQEDDALHELWMEFASLVEAERLRRHREVRDLERLYFRS